MKGEHGWRYLTFLLSPVFAGMGCDAVSSFQVCFSYPASMTSQLPSYASSTPPLLYSAASLSSSAYGTSSTSSCYIYTIKNALSTYGFISITINMFYITHIILDIVEATYVIDARHTPTGEISQDMVCSSIFPCEVDWPDSCKVPVQVAQARCIMYITCTTKIL